DPRALPWVRAELVQAFKLRRDGLFAVSTGESTERMAGRNNLETALKKFQQVLADARVLEDAFQRMDEAMVLLPALVAPLGEHPGEKEAWREIYSTVSGLLPKLDGPGAGTLAEVKSFSEALYFQLGQVRDRFSNEKLTERLSQAHNATEARQLLDYPVWTAAQRARIVDEASVMGHKMDAEAIAKATALKFGDPLPAALPSQITGREAWRAQLAIDLLRLDVDGEANVKLPADLPAMAKAADSAEAWDKLGQALRKAWPVALTARFRTSDKPTLAQQRIG